MRNTERPTERDPERHLSVYERFAEGPVEAQQRFDRLKLIMTLIGAIVAVLLLLGLAFIVVQAAPAEPVTIYESKLVTEDACPQESIVVATRVRVKSANVRAIQYVSTWEELGNPLNRKPAGTFTQHHVYQMKHPKTLAGPFLRVAPLQSGMWVLHTDATVYYNVAGIPRQDALKYDSKGVLNVDKLTTQRCQNA